MDPHHIKQEIDEEFEDFLQPLIVSVSGRTSEIDEKSIEESVEGNSEKSIKNAGMEPRNVTHNYKRRAWNVRNLRGRVYGCQFCNYCSKYDFVVLAHNRKKHGKKGFYEKFYV